MCILTSATLPFLAKSNSLYRVFKIGSFIDKNFNSSSIKVVEESLLLLQDCLIFFERGASYVEFRYCKYTLLTPFRCYHSTSYSKNKKDQTWQNCYGEIPLRVLPNYRGYSILFSHTLEDAGALVLEEIDAEKILSVYGSNFNSARFSLFLELTSLDLFILLEKL